MSYESSVPQIYPSFIGMNDYHHCLYEAVADEKYDKKRVIFTLSFFSLYFKIGQITRVSLCPFGMESSRPAAMQTFTTTRYTLCWPVNDDQD